MYFPSFKLPHLHCFLFPSFISSFSLRLLSISHFQMHFLILLFLFLLLFYISLISYSSVSPLFHHPPPFFPASFIMPENNHKFHYICPCFHSCEVAEYQWASRGSHSNLKRQLAACRREIFSPGVPWTPAEESSRSDNNKMSLQPCQGK